MSDVDEEEQGEVDATELPVATIEQTTVKSTTVEEDEIGEEESEIEEENIVDTSSYRGDAFVVFIRHEDKVLLMQRADGVADFPGAWDGVYGIGDSTDIDAITTRIE